MKTDYSHIFDDPMQQQKRHTDMCDFENCAEKGTFKAPKSRAGDYYWFCLDHVRHYNAAWNYYRDIADAELEEYIRKDITWQRPSWPLHARAARTPIHNTFDFEDLQDTRFEKRKTEKKPLPKESSELQSALSLLEMGYPFTKQELTQRFRSLVKKYHPDANRNDPTCAEILKKINEAYAFLKKHTPSL